MKNRIGGDLKRRKAARDDHPGNRFGQGPYRRGGMRPGGNAGVAPMRHSGAQQGAADRENSQAFKRAAGGANRFGPAENMDGSEGESAQNAREFGALLQEKTGLPVAFVDERGTTVTAHGYLNQTDVRGKKRKAVVDSVAAVIILQNYLDYRRNCL